MHKVNHVFGGLEAETCYIGFFFGVGEEFKTIHFTPMGSADYSFALRVQVTPGHLSASASVIVTFWCSHSKLCTFGSWNRCL